MLVCSFARDRPRFTDNLDVIKFLCKDLWTVLFKKQIDNLKTNHRVRQHDCNPRARRFWDYSSIDHNTNITLCLGSLRFDR